MSWPVIDPKLVRHPKVTGLSYRDRWAWLEVLCYCAEYATGGTIAAPIRALIPSATRETQGHLIAAGLLEKSTENGTLRVHDWDKYNERRDRTNAERQARWRAAQRNAGVTANVTPGVTGDNAGDNGESNAPAHARLQPRDSPSGFSRRTPQTPRGRNARYDEPPRQLTGDDVYRIARAWIDSPAFDAETMTAETAADELTVIEHRHHAEVNPAQRDALIAYAAQRHEAATT